MICGCLERLDWSKTSSNGIKQPLEKLQENVQGFGSDRDRRLGSDGGLGKEAEPDRNFALKETWQE